MNIWLAEIWRAWRASLRRPGFLLLATAVLALGVGASVAVFTLIDNVLLKPLPYPQPAQLVALGRDGGNRAVSPQQYQHLQGLQGVRSIGLIRGATPPVNVAGDGRPEQVPGIYVDHQLLPTLGVRMSLGRNFTAREDRANGPKAVILAHGFWLRRFGGDARAIGRRMQVEGVPHTIIGVLPASFDLLGSGDIMLPTALPANSTDDGTNYLAVARLAAGTDVGSVGAQVGARLHAMYAAMSDADPGWQHVSFGAMDLQATLHADTRPALRLFLASAALVLLIALVNLANLLLLRALARSHDAAVRHALGASAGRLALPGLAEGLLVGLGGAVLGALLAMAGLALLGGFVPPEWLGANGLRMGPTAWGMALAIGLLGALLAALLGWWRGHAATTIDELREGGRGGIGRHSGRLGRMLVVAQVALATVLLCGAGLFAHALIDASSVPLGFSDDGVLTFELAPVQASYPDVASVQALSRGVLDRLRAEPGVDSATVGTNLPVGEQFNMGVTLPDGDTVSAQFRGVDADFFKTFAIPVQAGRGLSKMDRNGGEPVAVVNQAFASHYMKGHELGQTLHIMGSAISARVVGVVGDTRQFGPLQDAPAIVYVPLVQIPDSLMKLIRSFIPLRFAVHVHGSADGYRDSVRAAVGQVAPQQPIANMRTLTHIVQESTSDTRLNLLLVGIFALLALLLAAVGMYAVMAVAVAAREREFGVRTALGAPPTTLARLVLRGGLWQVALGLVIGVGMALALSGVLRAVLQEIGRSAFDPLAILVVCLVLATAGLLACLLPAWRAGRVHPMRALRGE